MLGGCGRAKQAPARIPQASDSLYTARAALIIYGTEPERALAIIDSALIVGNVSPFRADFVRARIYANSVVGPRLDTAVDLCEVLLQHDSTRVVDKATAANRSDVLEVMMAACRKQHDDNHWLQYAIERADLSRSQGMETEALRMEAEIGAVMTRLGRRDEGLIKLEQVIHALDQGEPSVDRMDAGIVARKRRIIVYDDAGRFWDIIPDAEAIIKKLEDYRRRPEAYAEDCFRLPPDADGHARYCQFYTAQAQAYLACAYSSVTPPDLEKARAYVQLVEASDFGRSFVGRWTLTQVWKALGQWDKLLAIDAEAERRMGADTLNADYAAVLQDRADAARARGQYLQAISYMDRYTRLQRQLSEKRHETEAQEYAARYHAMEQEQMIREAQAQSLRKDTFIMVILAILFIICLFLFRVFQQRRFISEKNQALVRMINELTETREASQKGTARPDRELFDRIDSVIRGEKLYADANLQRQDIVDRFNVSRHALNDMFSAYADGQSFTAYVNNLRMQDALRLLQEEPVLSFSDIAQAVGFTPANFREQFKRQFGMTPTEYRQNL